MRLGAEIEGYEWELGVEGAVVELRRSRFPIQRGVRRQALYPVAVGQWDGERIAIRRWLPNYGDALKLKRDLSLLSDMIRMAELGG